MIMLQKSIVAFVVREEDTSNVYKLKEEVQTFAQASNSVIISLAAFIIRKYPNLHHPSYLDYQLPRITKEQGSTQENVWIHPMFQVWCDILADAVIDGNGYRVDNTLYIKLEIDQSYKQHLLQEDFETDEKQGDITIEEIFDLPEKQHNKKKKIALPNFAGSQLRTDKIQPKIHCVGLLVGIFFNNEQWNYYPILKGEIPSSRQLATHDAIILPGSVLSVMDRDPRIVKFMVQFKKAYQTNTKMRVMTVCFGHQLICDFFKAQTTKSERVEGQEKVRFIPETIQKHSFLAPLKQFVGKSCLMPEHHEDYVINVPQGFDLLGESDSCKIQSVISRDGRIFSMQFHAQYYSQFAEIFNLRQKNYNKNQLMSFKLGIQNQNADLHHQSCDSVRKCMNLFLQGL